MGGAKLNESSTTEWEGISTFDSWGNIYASIPGMFSNPNTAALFKALADSEGHIMNVAVRRGDIGESALDEEDRQQIAITPTIIATLLAYLKCATTGPRFQGGKRYQQHPQDTVHTYGGYHVDDWVRAILHLLFFLSRRRKSKLDGDEGPRGQPGIVLTFRADDSADQLPASQHHLVAQNVESLRALELSAATQKGKLAVETRKAKLGSTTDRLAIYKNGEAVSRMYKRTVIAFSAETNPSFDRKQLKNKPGQKRSFAPTETDIPPLDGLTIHAIIDNFYKEKRFEEPTETRLHGDITKIFPSFFGGQESFADFLATQETVVDRLATQDQRPGES